MFSPTDTDTLCANLDRFGVPMFAAERTAPDRPFRLLAVNAAHTRSTGLTNERVRGARVADLLPPEEAEEVEAHYARCVQTQAVIDYTEVLHIDDRRTEWRTTLQPVRTDHAAQRLVGTAVCLSDGRTDQPMTDTEYYAIRAQLQLGQVRWFLDTLTDRTDIPPDMREGAMRVANLSRSLDSLLIDIGQCRDIDTRPEANPISQLRSVG